MTTARPAKKRTSLTLDPDLVGEAKALNINVSEAAERGLIEALRQARRAAWLDSNADALQGANAWVEANGLPLVRRRLF